MHTARSMETAPRDSTMLRLLVSFTEHATDDADEAWTIGFNEFDHTGEDVWKFAGWCWNHDHFTEGKGTPIGWLPMFDEPQVETLEPVPEEWRDEAERLYDAVKMFPERRGDSVLVGGDGFHDLLVLRNHVGKLIAASPLPRDCGEIQTVRGTTL